MAAPLGIADTAAAHDGGAQRGDADTAEFADTVGFPVEVADTAEIPAEVAGIAEAPAEVAGIAEAPAEVAGIAEVRERAVDTVVVPVGVDDTAAPIRQPAVGVCSSHTYRRIWSHHQPVYRSLGKTLAFG